MEAAPPVVMPPPMVATPPVAVPPELMATPPAAVVTPPVSVVVPPELVAVGPDPLAQPAPTVKIVASRQGQSRLRISRLKGIELLVTGCCITSWDGY
jgi:hypothetical protein